MTRLVIDPRNGIDHRRVGVFAENIKDGFTFDMMARPETRPEIEPFTWGGSSDKRLLGFVSAKGKPDLIRFDPPYFDKKAADDDKKSISGVSRKA